MKKSILLFLFISSHVFANNLAAQIKHFNGNWTKVGTTYDFKFDLHIKHTDGNTVEGVFNWEFVNYDENFPASKDHYEKKIGVQAKEFVKGTYNPKTRQYLLTGYRKEDPNRIIALDFYRIKVDENGDIGGDSKAHGTWMGRINGKGVRDDQA